MTQFALDFTDLERLVADLDAGGRQVNAAVGETLESVTGRAEDQYRRALAPHHRSGLTADGVRLDPVKVTPTRVTAGVANAWFVGRFLEDGTSRQAPRPYLDDAMRTSLTTFTPELTARLAARSEFGP